MKLIHFFILITSSLTFTNCGKKTSFFEYAHTESFTQGSTTRGKPLEILWVVDDSGSMGGEQAALAQNFVRFIEDFLQNDIRFKMAIVTTDLGRGYTNRAGSELTSERAKTGHTRFIQNFKNRIKVGIKGSGREKGLEVSKKFLERNLQWSDPKSYLIIIYVSDENDHSCPPNYPGKCPGGDSFQESSQVTNEVIDYYHNQLLQSSKKAKNLIKVFAIVNKPASMRQDGDGHIGTRYLRFASRTGGRSYNIRASFAGILGDLGKTISGLSSLFTLVHPTTRELIETVSINSVAAKDECWELYKDQAIRFKKDVPGCMPPEGSKIDVRYKAR